MLVLVIIHHKDLAQNNKQYYRPWKSWIIRSSVRSSAGPPIVLNKLPRITLRRSSQMDMLEYTHKQVEVTSTHLVVLCFAQLSDGWFSCRCNTALWMPAFYFPHLPVSMKEYWSGSSSGQELKWLSFKHFMPANVISIWILSFELNSECNTILWFQKKMMETLFKIFNYFFIP